MALGTSGVGPDQALAIVVHRLTGIGPITWPASAETIVLELRLPRVVAAMVVGAGLACAGTVFQAVLRNPLADPYIIGTAAGASLGAVAALILPLATVGWLGIGAVQAFAFAGGLGAVLVVYAVARQRGGTPVVTLLLAGYAVSSLLAAGVAFLLFASGRPAGGRRQLAARVAGRRILAAPGDRRPADRRQLHAHPPSLATPERAPPRRGGGRAPRHRRRAREADPHRAGGAADLGGRRDLGHDRLRRTRRSAPPPPRLRPDHRLLLPASMVYGALLLLVADLGARLAGGIPVGIVTALIGAPFFLWLLRRAVRPDA